MTSDVSEVLAPCPFCGSQPKVLPTRPDLDGDAWARVICVNSYCHVQPVAEAYVDQNPKAAAIAKWNTRAQPAVLAVPGWRPIDEAPKDGSLFLGCTLKGVVQIIKRNKYLHIWVHYDGRESARTMAYYMPLPAAPTIHADHVPDAGKMIHEGGEG